MNRSEAIAVIITQLASLDDERVRAVAGIVQDLAGSGDLARQLTAEELALIKQSKLDFKEGRTHSSGDARAITAAFLARLRGTSTTT